jgi:hypothetical protein
LWRLLGLFKPACTAIKNKFIVRRTGSSTAPPPCSQVRLVDPARFFNATVKVGGNLRGLPKVRVSSHARRRGSTGGRLGWGDLISAYGAAHTAWAQARERLRAGHEMYETLRSLGMSEDGARRAADLDRLLDEATAARQTLRRGLKAIQDNVDLIRALNLYAAAEGFFPDRGWPDEAAND